MKKIFAILVAAAMTLGYTAPSFATATQVDALIEKLIQKKIWTLFVMRLSQSLKRLKKALSSSKQLLIILQ